MRFLEIALGLLMIASAGVLLHKAGSPRWRRKTRAQHARERAWERRLAEAKERGL